VEHSMVVCPVCNTRVEEWTCMECGHSFTDKQPKGCPKCNTMWEAWQCPNCHKPWLIPRGGTQVSVLRSMDIMFNLPNAVLIHVDELRRHYAHPGDALETYVKTILHDCNEIRWDCPCNAFEESWNINSQILSKEMFNLIVKEIVRNSGSGLEHVEALYNLVNQHVRYTSEKGQILRFPIETLTLGKSDCEDQAIALAALYRAAGYESAIVRLWDYKRTFHHVCCAVRADKWIDVGLWTLGGRRENDYVWKVLDPAFDHPFNELPSWIEHYHNKRGKPWVPSEVGSAIVVGLNALPKKFRKDIQKLQ
jgi:hypothetical protein